ncbi:MAG: peptide deformylase [Patescibacteria group bacterium]
MRKIVYYPNKILREKTTEIAIVDKELLANIHDLKEVLLGNQKQVAGLAAPQVGLSRRFFGLFSSEKKEVNIYINPKIEAVFGERVRPMMIFSDGVREVFLEGCLSFPDMFGVIERYLKIGVSWDEIEKGKLVRKQGELNGIEAIAFQHESEHLDGILFIDYIKSEDGEFFKWVDGKKIKWSVDKII